MRSWLLTAVAVLLVLVSSATAQDRSIEEMRATLAKASPGTILVLDHGSGEQLVMLSVKFPQSSWWMMLQVESYYLIDDGFAFLSGKQAYLKARTLKHVINTNARFMPNLDSEVRSVRRIIPLEDPDWPVKTREFFAKVR